MITQVDPSAVHVQVQNLKDLRIFATMESMDVMFAALHDRTLEADHAEDKLLKHWDMNWLTIDQKQLIRNKLNQIQNWCCLLHAKQQSIELHRNTPCWAQFNSTVWRYLVGLGTSSFSTLWSCYSMVPRCLLKASLSPAVFQRCQPLVAVGWLLLLYSHFQRYLYKRLESTWMDLEDKRCRVFTCSMVLFCTCLSPLAAIEEVCLVIMLPWKRDHNINTVNIQVHDAWYRSVWQNVDDVHWAVVMFTVRVNYLEQTLSATKGQFLSLWAQRSRSATKSLGVSHKTGNLKRHIYLIKHRGYEHVFPRLLHRQTTGGE